MKKSFKNKSKKIIVVLLAILFFSCNFVYASSDPKIVTGSETLLNDALKWILILIPTAATAMMAFQYLMKILNDDEANTTHRNRRIKQILIATAVGESVAGVITAITAYYK